MFRKSVIATIGYGVPIGYFLAIRGSELFEQTGGWKLNFSLPLLLIAFLTGKKVLKGLNDKYKDSTSYKTLREVTIVGAITLVLGYVTVNIIEITNILYVYMGASLAALGVNTLWIRK